MDVSGVQRMRAMFCRLMRGSRGVLVSTVSGLSRLSAWPQISKIRAALVKTALEFEVSSDECLVERVLLQKAGRWCCRLSDLSEQNFRFSVFPRGFSRNAR
jgi:hypothetical protein